VEAVKSCEHEKSHRNNIVVNNMLVFFRTSIYLKKLDIFTVKYFYKNSVEPTNKKNLFAVKRASLAH